MDTQTAARLVAEHSQAVYRLAYVRTGSREDAEDIVQETFLRLVRAEPELLDSAHQRAWLLRVAGVVLLLKAIFQQPVKWENFLPAVGAFVLAAGLGWIF